MPTESTEEVYDYAEFISERFEETSRINGVSAMKTYASPFVFLDKEEDLCSIEDLKGRF